jgi:hypothetical protein
MYRTARPVLHLELTIPSLIGDTPDEVTKRRSDTKHAMLRLFRFAIACFGEADARQMWTAVAKSPRGAPKGSRDPQKDQFLLALYDKGTGEGSSRKALGRWPRRVGLLLDAAEPGRYGASPAAIEKHVRRLVRERDKQRRADKEQMSILSGRASTAFFMSDLISDAEVGLLTSLSDDSPAEGQKFQPI